MLKTKVQIQTTRRYCHITQGGYYQKDKKVTSAHEDAEKRKLTPIRAKVISVQPLWRKV